MKSASHSARCLATHSAIATCPARSSGTPAGGNSCRVERLTRPSSARSCLAAGSISYETGSLLTKTCAGMAK
eukprot:14498134-Alexandrium_andersonii.AAC.1